MYPTLYEGIYDPDLKQVHQQSDPQDVPTLYEGIYDPALKQIHQQLGPQDVPNTV